MMDARLAGKIKGCWPPSARFPSTAGSITIRICRC